MANPPSIERPDLQDLLAYIEGRGDEAVRAQVLKRLDEDEEYLALMIDLVPMLRDTGVLSPPAEEPAAEKEAAVELPAPAPVIGHPSRFRFRPGLVSALAALVPIAVGVWLYNQANSSLPPYSSNQAMAAKISRDWVKENPLVPLFRSGGDAAEIKRSSDFLKAGMLLLDLEVTIQKQQLDAARDAVLALSGELDSSNFLNLLGTVQGLLDKGEDPSWQSVEAEFAEGFSYIAIKPAEEKLLFQGMCWRATWLAAKAKNNRFFEDELSKSQCLEVIGEKNWRADSNVIEDAFYSRP